MKKLKKLVDKPYKFEEGQKLTEKDKELSQLVPELFKSWGKCPPTTDVLEVIQVDKKKGVITFQAKEQIKKNKPDRDPEYRRFLNTLCCTVCGKKDSEACHTEYRGMGSKGSDYFCINLCAECHRGTKGLDRLGTEKFEKEHKVSIVEINRQCLIKYIKFKKGKDSE